MADDRLAAWLATTLNHAPADPALFRRALTHGSHPGGENYERLEFLGDRVLGLVIADWLCDLFPEEPEGKLSRRFHALVSGETCAAIARDIGLGPHVRLGKQARDDGAGESDYILGDVLEALIGAVFLEAGLEPTRRFIRGAWAGRVEHQHRAPQHPKSALQEWAASKNHRSPVYTLVGKAGPPHAPRFTVSVEVPGKAASEAEGASKQEAETLAAKALLDQVGAR